MKILIVQDQLRSGGTERQTLLLARSFAAAGHSTTLLTFRPGGALAPTGDDEPFTHFALQSTERGFNWWAPGLVRAARQLAPRIVLLMGRMANCYGTTLQRALPDAAVVCTLRTGKPLPWPFRHALRRVRHIVANSRAARQHAIATHAIAPARISVIHNALAFTPPMHDVDSVRARRRAEYGTPADAIVLLDVAMFRPEKNQIALLDIVAGLDPATPVCLWLAGDGPALESCRARALQLGLGDRVRFLGWLADPSSLYAAADLAVHASHSESFSNFLIEAQTHGLPAIAYAAQGVDETFVPDESGFLIPVDDAAAFTARLSSLISDPTLRQKMAGRAREFADGRFTPAAQTAAYLDLFHRLSAGTTDSSS